MIELPKQIKNSLLDKIKYLVEYSKLINIDNKFIKYFKLIYLINNLDKYKNYLTSFSNSDGFLLTDDLKYLIYLDYNQDTGIFNSVRFIKISYSGSKNNEPITIGINKCINKDTTYITISELKINLLLHVIEGGDVVIIVKNSHITNSNDLYIVKDDYSEFLGVCLVFKKNLSFDNNVSNIFVYNIFSIHNLIKDFDENIHYLFKYKNNNGKSRESILDKNVYISKIISYSKKDINKLFLEYSVVDKRNTLEPLCIVGYVTI